MEKRIQFKRQKRFDLETQFWQRTFAFAIDFLILNFIIIPIFASVMYFFNIIQIEEMNDISTDSLSPFLNLNKLISVELQLLIFILYSSFMESSSLQGTFGKWFLRCKVCDTDNNKISLLKALLRNSLKLISIASVIGVAIIDMNPKRQALHDLIVKTVVNRI